MNRRGLLTFLGIAPIAAPVAILAARDASAAGSGVRTLLANSKYDAAFWRRVRATCDELHRRMPPLRPLTDSERVEFRRTYIDPMEAELLESRRITHDEVCKFMGVPTKAVAP